MIEVHERIRKSQAHRESVRAQKGRSVGCVANFHVCDLINREIRQIREKTTRKIFASFASFAVVIWLSSKSEDIIVLFSPRFNQRTNAIPPMKQRRSLKGQASEISPFDPFLKLGCPLLTSVLRERIDYVYLMVNTDSLSTFLGEFHLGPWLLFATCLIVGLCHNS